MNIQVTKGHITQTEKTHIKALFNNNLIEGKVNRKTYFLDLIENKNYKVQIFTPMKNDYGKKYNDKHTSYFTLKN